MAKRQEKSFSYGSSAIPDSERKYSVIRWGWGGLNRTDTIDTGQITDCEGIVIDPPYVSPALIPHLFMQKNDIISAFGFGDKLFVIYRSSGKIAIDCITKDGQTYTGTMGNAIGTDEDFKPRTMIQFNVASNTENIVEATYIRELLIFPDAYSVDLNISSNFTPKSLGESYPDIKYATVYGSRVFGVDENLVYASSYNDYADWDLDTADEYSEANAWVSMSQSNVKADGEFTAIATYDNHVVLFKRDFMQLVYNNKNPFRIVDVGSYGCDNPYAVAECNGILYFASSDAVYSYGGGVPKRISDVIDVKSYRGARLGSWNGVLYLYAEDNIYTYKDGVWSCRGVVGDGIKQWVSLDWGIAAVCKDNSIRFFDWLKDGNSGTPNNWEQKYGSADSDYWWFETDFMALKQLDVRRVKKFSLLCDLEPDSVVAVYLLKNGEKFSSSTSQLLGYTNKEGQTILRAMVRGSSAYMHRLCIAGRGNVKIYAAELQVSWGGDLYVEG